MAKEFPDFVIDPVNGASGNTGKGYYKISVNSGGATTPVVGTHYVQGATSGATAIIMNMTMTSGTWAGSNWAGTIHLSTPVGTFQNGENLILKLISDNTTVLADSMTTTSVATVDAFLRINDCTSAKGNGSNKIIRYKKSLAPTDSGINATFTNNSATLTLASSLTYNINLCNAATGWTAYNSATVTTSTTRREGTNSIQLTFPASPVANTKYLVFDIGAATDLSAYEQISFWLRDNTAAVTTTGVLVFKLCSDAAGDVALHTFTLNDKIGSQSWQAMLFNNAAALANNVRSFAIYTGASLSSIASDVIQIDNILACKGANASNCLTLMSGVGDSSDDSWKWAVRSINDTAVVLDAYTELSAGTIPRGWVGTAGTKALWVANGFYTYSLGTTTGATDSWNSQPAFAGNLETITKYIGGHNDVTLEVDGKTAFCQRNGCGAWFTMGNASSAAQLENLVIRRGTYAIYISTLSTMVFKDMIFTNVSYSSVVAANNAVYARVYFKGTNYFIAGVVSSSYGYIDLLNVSVFQYEGTIYCRSNQSGYPLKGGYQIDNYFNKLDIRNGGAYAIYNIGSFFVINDLYTSDNTTGAIYSDCDMNIHKATINESTEVSIPTSQIKRPLIKISQMDGTANTMIYTDNGTIYLYTQKPADAVYAWKISPASLSRNVGYEMFLSLGKFRVKANAECTFKARMYKSASDIAGSIFVRGGIIAGVDSDVEQISNNTSDWEDANSLLTLTCTPTEEGWIELWAKVWYPNSSSTPTRNVYLCHPAADGNGDIPLFRQA